MTVLQILLFDNSINKRKGEGGNSCTEGHLDKDS
jgi:hypothetical protein